jgi:hypothetical protein
MLDEIRDSTEIDRELYFNITIFLQNNYSLLYGKVDEDKLESDLPQNLYEQVMTHKYGPLIKEVKMFKDYDMEMIWSLVGHSERREWFKGEVIY